MRATRIKTTGLAFLLLGSTAAVSSVWAQSSDEDGGIQLRLDLGLGIETQSNRTLSPSDPGSTTQAYADLDFALSSITRRQALTFGLSGRLRDTNSPATLGLDSGLVNTTADLGYSLSGATSKLTLSAQLSEFDLADTTFSEDDLGDISLVNDDGVRRTGLYNARIDWNQDARVSYGAFARYNDTRFSGGSATSLDGTTVNNSTRLTLGADATLDITRAATLNVALSYSRFEEDDADEDRDTWSLDNTLTLGRPAGDVVFGFGITDTEEGTRTEATVGRTYTLPGVTFFGEIGLAHETSGGTDLIGALDVEYALPRGALSFGLARSVSSSNLQDEERLNTSVNMGYQQALTPLADISFDAQLAQSDNTDTGASFSDASLSVTYTRTLTRDWDMDLGARQRFSDDDGTGSANSSEIFFSMRRSYLARF